MGPFIVFVAMVACSCSGSGGPQTALPTTQVTVTGGAVSQALTVELATTAEEQERGLMYRQSMPEENGMLFLFKTDQTVGFWMKNTYIPLTIAYLDADGRVLELHDAQPLDTTIITPARPYRMTLEVNQGWFERHGLDVGSIVHVPPNVLAQDVQARASP